MKNLALAGLCIAIGFALGWFGPKLYEAATTSETGLIIPTFVSDVITPTEPPLQKYAIDRISALPIEHAPLFIEEDMSAEPEFSSYIFSWTTLGKRMTGQVNIPNPFTPTDVRVIVLLRGYVPEEIYETGVGTKNAAAVFAKNGYVTIAPDFFGYGESDPESEDTWQARFEKPRIVMELLRSIQLDGIVGEGSAPITTNSIGMWAHSNGGQIALTTLEAYELNVPTTLWAPVSAPFPYAIQFFSDELEDEGKEQRKWISLFEKEYDARDFSLTQHLQRLQAPLQLHHGEIDDAAPVAWSDEFVEKLELAHESTDSASVQDPYPITYYRYPNTDHNLQPSWNAAIARDVQFFAKHLIQ